MRVRSATLALWVLASLACEVAVWFASRAEGEKTGITLFLPGFVEGNEDAAQAAFLLLDGALGEYDVETKVGSIQMEPCPAEPAKAGLRPIAQLAAIVDAMAK